MPLIRVEGREHVPALGPVILASNHLSFIDSVVIRFAAPRRVMFLAKAEYFAGRGLRGRLVRWFFTLAGSVPVALHGTERLQPVGKRLPRPHRVTVRFGTPLHFAGDPASARARRTVTNEVVRAIGELSGQEHADRFAA